MISANIAFKIITVESLKIPKQKITKKKWQESGKNNEKVKKN